MIGYFFFFGGYESARSAFTPRGRTKDDLGPLATAVAGGFGGAALWVSIFPLDVVKSRMQIGLTSSPLSARRTAPFATGLLSTLIHIARTEGIRVLYRGLGPTLLRTFPATGALFVTVEWTRKLAKQLFP
ncbi:hypothetical protein AAHC03_05747 [Spirometra sp. Aus1]|nr:unnamed protein product [Spirometra erinaceieuropaei]